MSRTAILAPMLRLPSIVRRRTLALIAAVVLLPWLMLWWLMLRQVDVADDALVFLPLNTSVVAAVDSVHAHANLPTPWLVQVSARAVARLTGATIQSGWYVVSPESTQWDVVMMLFSSERRPTVRVTIPEGLTYREIAGLLARTVECDSAAFVAWCEAPSSRRDYATGAPSMEGYLMPDTYDFFWRTPAEDVAVRLAEEWQRRHADSTPTLEEVTLASIIQAETGAEREMPRIAGVYRNRLEKGMPLAADPTVQYGLGEKRRLYYKDLDKDTPYNTYLHTGLPPGPINNPGMAAIAAARHPEQHAFYFFVARGDGSGTHRFATSGWEHQRNVQRYRRSRRTN